MTSSVDSPPQRDGEGPVFRTALVKLLRCCRVPKPKENIFSCKGPTCAGSPKALGLLLFRRPGSPLSATAATGEGAFFHFLKFQIVKVKLRPTSCGCQDPNTIYCYFTIPAGKLHGNPHHLISVPADQSRRGRTLSGL